MMQALYSVRQFTAAMSAVALLAACSGKVLQQDAGAGDGGAGADGGLPAWFGRQQPDDVRVVSYNVLKDSVFKEGSDAAKRFARVVKALDADVWALQEVYVTGTARVAELFDKLAPLGDGKRWQARYGGDSVTVSRYPIKLHQWPPLSAGLKASMDLVDLPDGKYSRDIFLLNCHFTCCEGAASDAARQKEADQLVAWMRDAREADGSFTLPQGTPMVVVGDLNTVGSAQPLKTIISGDVINESEFGKDSPPDWDGTDLQDAHPVHNGDGYTDYTWRWDGSGYQPGRLDFVIFSDSAAAMGTRFVLNTVALDQQQLAAVGLQADDVIVTRDSKGAYVFDHLPVVVDLRLK